MKIIIVLVVLMLLIPVLSFAQGRNTTDRLTSDTLVCSGYCLLYGVFIETDGTNNVTLILYDNTTNSGKIIRKIIVPGGNYYGGFELPVGLLTGTGIYADVGGTGAAFWVTFGR